MSSKQHALTHTGEINRKQSVLQICYRPKSLRSKLQKQYPLLKNPIPQDGCFSSFKGLPVWLSQLVHLTASQSVHPTNIIHPCLHLNCSLKCLSVPGTTARHRGNKTQSPPLEPTFSHTSFTQDCDLGARPTIRRISPLSVMDVWTTDSTCLFCTSRGKWASAGFSSLGLLLTPGRSYSDVSPREDIYHSNTSLRV